MPWKGQGSVAPIEKGTAGKSLGVCEALGQGLGALSTGPHRAWGGDRWETPEGLAEGELSRKVRWSLCRRWPSVSPWTGLFADFSLGCFREVSRPAGMHAVCSDEHTESAGRAFCVRGGGVCALRRGVGGPVRALRSAPSPHCVAPVLRFLTGLSRRSGQRGKWGVEISSLRLAASFSLAFCPCPLPTLGCSAVGCTRAYSLCIFLANWLIYHCITSFLIPCHRLT